MSNWLGTHIREFVIPNLEKLLTEAKNRDTKLNYDGVRPAGGCDHLEGARLYTALKQAGFTDETDISFLKHTSSDDLMTGLFGSQYVHTISGRNVSIATSCHSAVKASLRQIYNLSKRKTRTRDVPGWVPVPADKIVLTGRDMWLWNVMAHKMGIEVVYDPRVSRHVAQNGEAFVNCAVQWEGVNSLNKAILLDTGFSGSIYRALCKATGDNPTSVMMSAEKNGMQQFPSLKCAREIAYKIEDTPKYWTSGVVENSKDESGRLIKVAKQNIAGVREFVRATALTIWCWHHQSPTFIHNENFVGKMSAVDRATFITQKKASKDAKKHLGRNKDSRAIRRKVRSVKRIMQSISNRKVSLDKLFIELEASGGCIICLVSGHKCESCGLCHHEDLEERKKYFTTTISDAGVPEDRLGLIKLIKSYFASSTAMVVPTPGATAK